MPSNSLKATLPSLQSMKVPRESILITENKGETITATRLYLAAFGSVTTLISRPTPGELLTALYTQHTILLTCHMHSSLDTMVKMQTDLSAPTHLNLPDLFILLVCRTQPCS